MKLSSLTLVVFLGLFWMCISCENVSKETPKQKQVVFASETDIQRADSLFEAGRTLYYNRKFKESTHTFLQADSLYKLQPNYEKQLTSRINTVTALQALYTDSDSILRVLDEYIPLLDKLPVEMLKVSEYYNTLHHVHYNNGNYIDANFYAEKALKRAEKMPDSLKKTNAFLDVYFFSMRALILNAQELYNYEEAIQLSKNMVTFARKNAYNVFSAEMELMTTYVYAEKFDEAKAAMQRIENESIVDEKQIFDAFDFYRAKIKLLMNTQQFEKALVAIESLQNLIDNSGYGQHFSQWFLTQLKSDVLLKMKAYEQVILYVENLQVAANYEKATIGYRSADFHKLAKAYLALDDVGNWQKNTQKAINLHLPTSQQTDDFFKEISLENARFKDFMLARVMFKAKSCFEYYQQTKKAEYLQIALSVFKEAHEMLKSLGAQSDEDAFITNEQFDQFYNDLLELYHEKWSQTQETAIFYEAFSISDESKNVLILNELKQASITKLFSNIPEHIRAEKTLLQRRLDSLAYLSDSSENQAKKSQTQTQLTALKTEIKQQFPRYYALKYSDEISIEKLINDRYATHQLISYAATQKHIFVFYISEGNIIFDKINFDEDLQDTLQTYTASLQDFQNNAYQEKESIIFSTFVKPYFDVEKPTVLLLDGALHSIPFDAFSATSNYRYPFIRLNTLRSTISSNSEKTLSSVVYAPFTDKHTQPSLWLPNSLQEANAIQKVMNATVKTNDAAAKEAFLSSSENFDVIHLATHSVVNTNVPMESAVYFYAAAETTPSQYLLKASSLYNMNLPAELVTLSSCESGSGTLVSGRGVQSLSNAFTYAGAKSTVMSLWKTPDQTTAQLMNLFYQNLKEGKDKATALQLAKKQYVTEVDDENFRHPYYWAGFVITGDVSPLQISESIPIWWYLFGLLLLIVCFGFLYRSRKKKQSA